MQNVAIFPVVSAEGDQTFRAVSRTGQSEGKTAGQALDGLRSTMRAEEFCAVVIQPFVPDSFFTAQQQARLQELMSHWRAARDSGKAMSPQERDELRDLVEAELQASAARASQITQGLGA